MAELDSLSIGISASVTPAITAIDKLVDALETLDDALLPAANGLHRTADALERIASLNGDIAGVAKSLKKLGDASNSLSNVGKNGKQAGDAVSKLAKKLSGDLGITDKNGISQLSKALHDFYSSTTSGEMQNAYDKIERIARNFGHVEGEISDARKQALAFISELNNRKINNPLDYTKEFGDTSNGRRIRANLGLENAVKTGGSDASEVAKDLLNNDFGGVNADAYRALAEEAEKARQIIRDTAEESMTMSEALSAGGEAAIKATEAYRNLGQALADAVGMSQKQLGDAMSGGDGFLGEDPTEQTDAMRQFALLGENLLNMGNPLENITTGLQELGNIELSDTLNNIQYIKDAVSKIGGDSGARAGDALTQIAYGLHAFDDVDIPNFGDSLTNLAVGLRGLGSGQMVTASQVLPFIADGLRQLNGITITTDFEKISGLASAVAGFGYAKVEKTIANLPVLTSSLRELIDMLANAPEVSERTLMLLNTISQINVKGNNLSKSIDGASSSLKRFTGYAHKAHKASLSLASIAGKLYANFFMLFRALRWFGNSIDLAAQLVEVQNVVDVTFADMSGKMNQFAKDATDSLGMSELTAKKIGSQFQAMGTAMNIPSETIRQTSEFVNKATNGYAEVSDSMADMSMNLTKLTGDMASFYNMDYEDVATKMNAIFTGQTRPLRVFGLDLTQATLQEWALANGMDVEVKKMTQAEKTMLRYQYVMANTTAAQGDFERTINSFSNQIRIAKERINQLRIVLGKIGMYTFKPLVKNFNSAMTAIIDNATATFNALGKIFGWQIEWSDTGVLQDEADGLEDIADGYDDAADSAKKFKNFLLGIDELNLLPDDKDSGKGDDDLTDLYANYGDMEKNLNIKETEGVFDSIYDTLFKLGKRIGEVEKEWLQGIDWDSIYDKARNFGKGLAEFLNGYLSDAELFYEKGKFIANGINTIANAIDGFFKEFNGWQFGVDIGNLINGFTENLDWPTIKSAAEEMAHDLAMTINGALATTEWDMVGHTVAESFNTVVDFFYTLGDEINWDAVGSSIAEAFNKLFEDFDFSKLASTLNKWAKGMLNTIITALKRADWKLVGRKIGEFISGIDVLEIAGKIGGVLWEAINAAIKLWIGLADTAPIETLIATAIAIPFSNRNFRRNFGGIIGNFTTMLGNELFRDLSNVFNGSMWNTFLGGFMDVNVEGFFGNLGSGLSAVSQSLSPVTKTLGGIGTVVGEYVAIKDAVFEIASGSENIAGNIGKVVEAAGLAAGALAVLFGPAGAVAAIPIGLQAAIGGYMEAMEELERSTIIGTLTDDLGESYTKVSEIAGAFGTVSSELQTIFDKLNDKEGAIDTAQRNLEEVALGFEKIGSAAQNGNIIAFGAIDELSGKIDTLRLKWKEYIDSTYDYLISQAYADWNLLESQGVEFDEQAMIDRIAHLMELKDLKTENMEGAIGALETSWATLKEVEEEYGKDSQQYADAMDDCKDAIIGVNDGLRDSGVIVAESNKELENAMGKLSEISGLVDFSELGNEGSTYEEFVKNFLFQTSEMEKEYNATMQAMENDIKNFTKRTIQEEGFTESAQAAIAAKRTAVGNEMEMYKQSYYNSLEDMQQGLYNRMFTMIGYEGADYDVIQTYTEEIVNPIYEGLLEQYQRAGDDILPSIKQETEDFIERAFLDASEIDLSNAEAYAAYTMASQNAGEEAVHVLSDSWQQAWWDVSDEYKEGPYQAIMQGVEGIKEGFNVLSNANQLTTFHTLTGQIDDATDALSEMKGIGGHASNTILNINQNMKRLDASTLIRMKDEFDKTTLKAADMKTKVENLTSTFGTMKDKLSSSKTFEGVKKSADDVVVGFDNIKNKGMDAVDVVAKNLSDMTGQIKVAYDGITADTEITVGKINGEVEKMFSADTWKGTVSVLPNVFKTMWEDTIKVMKTMWTEMANWINQNAKIEIPKTKIGNTEIGGTDIRLKVPKYEKGGFPEDGLFMANHNELVGSFENGRTVVANNGQIVDGIKQGVYEAVVAALATSSKDGNVTVELHGDAAGIFTAVVKENNNAIMRTGSSPIRR